MSLPLTKNSGTEDIVYENKAGTENVSKEPVVLNEANEAVHPKEANIDEPPDGGYGYVVALCLSLQNAVSWGLNSTFGVYLSFYLENDYFPAATPLQFAFIGGLSISQGMMVAPLANFLTSRYGFKTPMTLGAVLLGAGQILAGFSKEIWQLFITQGLLFGWGLGFTFVPALPLLSQWFTKKRSLANGLSAAGSGMGGLIFANTTRLAIDNLSLRWAFIINGLISLCVMAPVLLLLKSRSKQIGARFAALEFSVLMHPGFAFVWMWAFMAMLAYICALFTLATYATAGLGLSQSKGAAVQSVLSAGMIIGRPLCGVCLDKWGHINGASAFSMFAALTILLIWMFARSYAVIIVFAFLQGCSSGIIWSAIGAVSAEVVGLRELGSALSVTWLVLALPGTFSEPITLELIQYSQKSLGRTGADAFLISIGFSGACYAVAALLLLGAKRYVQGDWKVLKKS